MTADGPRRTASTADPTAPDTPRVTAPANLLLLGEYAVLEEGGLGIAIAPDVRAWASAEPASPTVPPTVRGVLPDGEARWPGDTGLLGRVADYLVETIGPPPTAITVDTAAFFAADGRKRGYGSSAALTVALCALWIGAAEGSVPAQERVRRVATEAHRAAQGGRGSGYDVAVSSCGGVVLFTGGAEPGVRRLELPWLPPVVVFTGRAPVATPGAVGRFNDWRDSRPDDADAFLRRSNELVRRFAAAASWEEARPIVHDYRDLTLDLGERIGVPARMEPNDRATAPGSISKAVGAGDELGVVFEPDASTDRALPIAAEGIRWE